MQNISKLLSHRLRSFDSVEHSPSGFKNACNSIVPYVEVDTRASKDNEIYLFHDYKTGKYCDHNYTFAKTTSSVLNKIRLNNGEPLLNLHDAIDIFQKRKLKTQKLCIDIKDYGFEEIHLEKVCKNGLEDHVCFISWIPQTLMRLYKLGARSQLFLSHYNFSRLSILGKLISSFMNGKIFKFFCFVILGERTALEDLGSLTHGYQHGLICQELPESLIEILSKTNGGICVHRIALGKRLYSYCKRKNLKIWVFSVNNLNKYLEYANYPYVDVIFCNDTISVLKGLSVDHD